MNTLLLGAILIGGVVLAGCGSNQAKREEPAAPPPAAAPAPAPVPAPECKEDTSKAKGKTKSRAKDPACAAKAVDKPATAAPAAAPASTGRYDLSRNKPVTDSTKVQAGRDHGQGDQ